MSDAFRANPEELLRESRWVRELARSLAIDPSSADDLAQETWLAALRNAPNRLGSPRGWLGQVLRNVARHDHRRTELRVGREEGAARHEALPSTVQIAARAELQRTLVAAVLALDEPYRSTILWRYFEDLSSEEIARRLDASSSTVRNRLRRGLERLRTALERHDASNWQDRCLALAAFSSGAREGGAAVASSWIKGGVVMGTKAKLVLGLAATLAVSAVMWNEVSRPTAMDQVLSKSQLTSAMLEDSDSEPRASGSRDKLPVEVTSTIERSAIESSRTPAMARKKASALVFGDVRVEGTPPTIGRVELQDEWGERASAAIDRNAYAIPGLHAGRWRLVLRDCAGYFATAQELDLVAGASLRADIDLRRSQSIAIRLTSASGEDIERLFGEDAWNGVYGPRMEVVATREPLPLEVSAAEIARLSCGTYTSTDAAGRPGHAQVPTGFSGVLELHGPAPAFASAMLRGRVLKSALIEPDTRELEFVIDSERMLATLGSLRFRLVSAQTGEPIERAGIQLREDSTVGLANPAMWPRKDGVYERPRLPSGTYELQIRAPGFEHTVKPVTIESGRVTDLGDLRLSDGGVVRGLVVDEAGTGVSALLCWSSIDAKEDPNFIEDSRSASDGSFGLAELPAHGVLFRSSDPQWALDPVPVYFTPNAIGEITLTVRPGTAVTLRHRFEGAVRLIVRRTDGTPIWSKSELGPSTHRIRLLQGSYKVEVVGGAKSPRTTTFAVTAEPVQLDLE